MKLRLSVENTIQSISASGETHDRDILAANNIKRFAVALSAGLDVIAIVNVSKNPSAFGVHQYELRINTRVIAKFEHVREEGLTVCLQKAAQAAECAKWEEAAEMIKLMTPNAEIRGGKAVPLD
jgi:hypothetical protein